MNFIYNFLGLAFLMSLFWGYGGFNILESAALTVVSFGITIVGFIRSESRAN